METLVQANIFFFISSLAVIAISIGLIILIIKIHKLVSALDILINKFKNMTDYASDEAEDLIEDIKESFIFRLFFPKTKRKSKKNVIKKVVKKINN
jgi:hypothetical protein